MIFFFFFLKSKIWVLERNFYDCIEQYWIFPPNCFVLISNQVAAVKPT